MRIGAVFALALAGAAAFAQTVDNSPPIKQQILDGVNSIVSQKAFVPGVDFSKWPEFLKAEQPQIDAAANDEDFQKAVNEALKKFGASHTVLNAPRLAQLRMTGAMVGIGINTHVVPDGLLVTRTIDDAPAQRGGIVPGDTITSIDGKPAVGTKGIEGREGTDVTLTVRHVDKSSEDYILTRRKFSAIRPEELHWLNKDTVLLSVSTFGYTYSRKQVADFMKEAQPSKNLILDLRDNGGGEIGNLRHLLGYLVPSSKPVGTFIDRTMSDEYTTANHAKSTDLYAIAKWTRKKVRGFPDPEVPVYKGRIVVLVDAQSGSASEIVAAGLRDTLGSTIIGTKTAGMVLVSLYVDVSNGFMLQFPLSDYVTINGIRLEGTGVTPDIIEAGPTIHSPNYPDPAVDKALALFAAKPSN